MPRQKQPDEQAIADAAAFDVERKLAELNLTKPRGYRNKITLFNGQWADLNLDQMARFARDAGYDGLELCTWGKSLDVTRMLDRRDGHLYIEGELKVLRKHNIGVWAMSAHIQGQAAAQANAGIDEDLMDFLPPRARRMLNRGDYDGIRDLGVKILANTVRAAAKLRDVARKEYGELGEQMWNPTVITMFTGSPIWHRAYLFPGMSEERIDAAFAYVAERMKPVLEVCARYGINLGLEPHPTEIAFDGDTTTKLLDKMDKVPYGRRFGVNTDGSHLGYQGVDPVKFIEAIGKRGRIYHSHIKDVDWGLDPSGLNGVFGSHKQFGAPGRYWDFRSIGRGRINQAAIIDALAQQDYDGPLSVEWEDPRLAREAGAIASSKVVRGILTSNPDLVREGLKMYKDPANYKTAQFDKALKN